MSVVPQSFNYPVLLVVGFWIAQIAWAHTQHWENRNTTKESHSPVPRNNLLHHPLPTPRRMLTLKWTSVTGKRSRNKTGNIHAVLELSPETLRVNVLRFIRIYYCICCKESWWMHVCVCVCSARSFVARMSILAQTIGGIGREGETSARQGPQRKTKGESISPSKAVWCSRSRTALFYF